MGLIKLLTGDISLFTEDVANLEFAGTALILYRGLEAGILGSVTGLL
jgi:hypothetical protein